MRIVNDHIIQSLDDFISVNDKSFEWIFDEMQYARKENYKQLLKYIHRVLTEYEKNHDNNELDLMHFHFEDDLEEYIKQLIAEFVIISQFNKFTSRNAQSDNSPWTIREKKLKINATQKKLATCPDGASGKNGGNKIYKNWQNEKGKTIALLKFYERFNESISLCPRVVFNCLVKFQSEILDSFIVKPFAINGSNKGDLNSCVILNTESLSSIRKKTVDGQFLLKLIETVILFDSENSIKRFGEFNAERINDLNINHGTDFKSLVIFSFGKRDNSFKDIREKIDLVKARFKLHDNTAYTLLSSEFTYLKNYKVKNEIAVNFWGIEKTIFWDTFILETSIRDLYELRSMKMLNLYSLAFNDDIKQYILKDIFSENEKSRLLSEETKQVILQLNEEDRKVINDSLANSLNLITQESWLKHIISIKKENSEIILPEEVIKDNVLLSKISAAIQLTDNNKLSTWSSLDIQTIRPVMILAYRDQGKYPYYFNQNILETYFQNSYLVCAEFLRCFFHTQYEWAKFNFAKDIQKYLNHPIREQSFKWSELKRKIKAKKPEARDTTLWDLENEYTINDNRETIKVKFKVSKKSKIYLASDLFIVKFNNDSKFKVERLSELANLDLTDELIAIQSIDEIQESINIYERIVDLDQQEMELNLIRDQFNLSEADPARLWKILLKKKTSTKSEKEVYDELNDFLKLKKLKFVSFFHFKNIWINPTSESLTPLSKKVFISLCEYLDIPRAYYAIMQRIKNTSKQASRQSTRQMNYLLKDLFNDGCFDDVTKVKTILEGKIHFYKRNHPSDELGTNDDRLLDVLVTLVELIHPELILQEIESLQKIEE